MLLMVVMQAKSRETTKVLARYGAMASVILAATGGGVAGVAQTAVVPADQLFEQKEAALFDVKPQASACDPGRLKASERQQALRTVNDIRRAHDLPPVAYDPSGDGEAMAASMMMAVNSTLNHFPPATWRCYTVEGANGAKSSNMAGGTVSPYLSFASTRDQIIGWVIDKRNLMGGTGHRRWILSPFLTQISYGHAGWQAATGERTAASALKVFNFAAPGPVGGAMPDFVAYPVGDYPVAFYEPGALLSFSPVVDKTDMWNNIRVDLSHAAIHVRSEQGEAASTIVARRADAIGGAAALEFRVDPLVAGISYVVQVTGIRFNGTDLDYRYGFRLMDKPAP